MVQKRSTAHTEVPETSRIEQTEVSETSRIEQPEVSETSRIEQRLVDEIENEVGHRKESMHSFCRKK